MSSFAGSGTLQQESEPTQEPCCQAKQTIDLPNFQGKGTGIALLGRTSRSRSEASVDDVSTSATGAGGRVGSSGSGGYVVTLGALGTTRMVVTARSLAAGISIAVVHALIVVFRANEIGEGLRIF